MLLNFLDAQAYPVPTHVRCPEVPPPEGPSHFSDLPPIFPPICSLILSSIVPTFFLPTFHFFLQIFSPIFSPNLFSIFFTKFSPICLQFFHHFLYGHILFCVAWIKVNNFQRMNQKITLNTTKPPNVAPKSCNSVT